MFSENEYFLTIECQMYDNKLNSWHNAWAAPELVKKRVENGVTYCAWSKNRKNGNHISACFKLADPGNAYSVEPSGYQNILFP